jgi:hypothetical protein
VSEVHRVGEPVRRRLDPRSLFLVANKGVSPSCGSINCDGRDALIEVAPKRVVFRNFAARGNSKASASTSDGIVFAPGATDFIVQGCILTNDAPSFGTQKYGVDNY